MSNRISIDTRTIKKGDLFIPIKGPNFDGHDFTKDALKKGARVLKVKNGKKALQEIAHKHRLKFDIPIIGITGSSGKTTTKDMLASILNEAYPTLKNNENFNNEIGVPLTLLEIKKKHKAAVIEMAVQRPGDMDELVKIVRPTHAIVTNIGDAHLKYFRSKKNTAREKNKILKFGAKKIKPAAKKELKGIKLPLPGKHNEENALFAIAAAKSLGISKKKMKRGLEKFKPSSKRMDIIKKHGITIINDTYNANPQSMRAAMETITELRALNTEHRTIAVLGDMLELGKKSKAKHKEVIDFAKRKKIDLVFTLGNQWPGKAFKDKSKLLAKLKTTIRSGDIILLKGSRSMKMETLHAAVVELADTYA
ncbi:UDP-N-acetylmuramoyl-tripeptide--D-alanyl-D-alanine ligase [Candidatus Margulisiibacteriota bacterium]